eukprot:2378480-Amphidinium_carterae.2
MGRKTHPRYGSEATPSSLVASSGQSNGALFYDTVTQARAVVRGDDFLVLGDDDNVKRMGETLRSRYDCKSGGVLGPEPEDDTGVTYLTRVIRCVRGSNPKVEIEHDMRYVDWWVRDLGLDGIKVGALDCPSVKVGMQEAQRRTDGTALVPAGCTGYRSGVMRIAYLSLGRPERPWQ